MIRDFLDENSRFSCRVEVPPGISHHHRRHHHRSSEIEYQEIVHTNFIGVIISIFL